MKITMVSGELSLTGGHRVMAIHAEKLMRRGHEVVVVATPTPAPSARDIARSLLKGKGWPKRHPRRMASHFDESPVECKVIDRPRPITDADVPDADVVIATWWETAEWVGALGPSKGAKVYFVQHYEIFPYLPVERVEATWRLPLRKVAVAQWLVDLARERYGDNAACLVPNAVDLEQFHAPPRGRNAVPTVGMIYSLAPFKGCDVSLRAFELCAERMPGLRLITFGNLEVAEDLPLPNGAEFHLRPHQDALRTLYASCDVWLVGSRSEGFGLPILEAMACRTPVIATRTGAAPELIGQGGGYLVEPEDAEGMAAAMERLLALSESEWRALSDAAHATAARYTWDDANTLFEKALYQAAGRA